MANKWRSVNIGMFLPNQLLLLADGASEIADQTSNALNAIKSALEIAKALAAAAATNPIEAALRALIDELNALIDALTEDSAVHAIMIPFQKQYFGRGIPAPRESVDPYTVAPNFDQLVNDNAYAEQVVSDITPNTITFINSANTATGGNAGFWKELILSTRDAGDTARPRFANNFAVTGVALVYGSESMKELSRILAALDTLFFLGSRMDPSARTRPVAENVRVLAVPVPGENRIGVQIDWTPVPPVKINALYSDESFKIKEIFIVRSTDPRIRERFSWHGVFPTEPADSGLQESGKTKVIARLKNDGFISRYIDNDPALEENTTYYYTLALRYFIDDEAQPMAPFSAVRRAFYTRRPGSTRRSEPPDWWATPSLVQLFPLLEDYINQAQLFIASLLTRTTSNSGLVNVLQQIINQIERTVRRLEDIVEELERIIDLLRALTDSSLAAISSTKFSVSSGGLDGWLAELARRLSDTSDPTRPPFDNGELVGGVVIVAGAPNILQLTAVDQLLALFFGNNGASRTTADRVIDVLGDPPPSLNAVATSLLDNNGRLSPAPSNTTIVFAEDFTATRSTTPAVSPQFLDASLTPTTESDC